ncbi:MAG TPA: hypothetical protein VFD02_04075 [Syntrophomonadaceae bacterium]|nr:hypothetical protein [Syntrophomonadaceae bacterium]
MGLSPKRNLIPNRIMRGAVTRGLLAARNHRGKVRIKTSKAKEDKVDKTYQSNDTVGITLLKALIVIIAIIIFVSINLEKYHYITL